MLLLPLVFPGFFRTVLGLPGQEECHANSTGPSRSGRVPYELYWAFPFRKSSLRTVLGFPVREEFLANSTGPSRSGGVPWDIIFLRNGQFVFRIF